MPVVSHLPGAGSNDSPADDTVNYHVVHNLVKALTPANQAGRSRPPSTYRGEKETGKKEQHGKWPAQEQNGNYYDYHKKCGNGMKDGCKGQEVFEMIKKRTE